MKEITRCVIVRIKELPEAPLGSKWWAVIIDASGSATKLTWPNVENILGTLEEALNYIKEEHHAKIVCATPLLINEEEEKEAVKEKYLVLTEPYEP